jgi:hypothetical protein
VVVQVVVRRQMQAVAPIFIQNLQISRVNRGGASLLFSKVSHFDLLNQFRPVPVETAGKDP